MTGRQRYHDHPTAIRWARIHASQQRTRYRVYRHHGHWIAEPYF